MKQNSKVIKILKFSNYVINLITISSVWSKKLMCISTTKALIENESAFY